MFSFLNRKLFKKFRILFFLVTVLTIITTLYCSNALAIEKTFKVFYNNIYDLNIYANFNKRIENSTIFNGDESLYLINKTIFINHINSTINKNISEQCPLIPPNLGTRIKLNLKNYSISDIEELLNLNQSDLKIGGRWSPRSCKARHKVAIIVPYRDRDYNLQLFLLHMHPFLRKQQLDYGLYLIEPIANLTFNRGLLMNIGFVESMIDTNSRWECFVFHDVDLLPEDERNIYSCPGSPRHMSSAVSTLNYKLPYEKIFGGVTEFTKEQFQRINGFSNLFFGWGGEDDDLRERVIKKGFSVSRYPLDIGRYTMAKHSRDKDNKPNPNRYKLLKTTGNRIDKDGVNTLSYEIKSITKNKLFTKILVSYDKDKILKNNN